MLKTDLGKVAGIVSVSSVIICCKSEISMQDKIYPIRTHSCIALIF